MRSKSTTTSAKIKYAVVGLGYFAQEAVLPAFKHARNSELVAFVSSDPAKHKRLGKRYGVRSHFTYEGYDECLQSGIDAVYIALPNSMHREYAVRAAEAGIHVLCEKPMAVTESECQNMIDASENNKTKLMIAYRLHFEAANLKAIDSVNSGRLGKPRFFSSVFSQQVPIGNIRLKKALGGGPLYDMGVYAINASRYLFRDEPTSAFAFTGRIPDHRFKEVEEMTTGVLRFPGDRLASFTVSFGASDTSSYRVVGTKGDIQLEPAYDFSKGLASIVTVNGKKTHMNYPLKDQLAAELIYFSNCIMKNRKPEPSGEEGLADVRIVRALYESARTGRVVTLTDRQKQTRPNLSQKITRPPNADALLVHVQAPSK